VIKALLFAQVCTYSNVPSSKQFFTCFVAHEHRALLESGVVVSSFLQLDQPRVFGVFKALFVRHIIHQEGSRGAAVV